MNKDYLVRVVTRDANIRGLACVTTRLVTEACRLHGTYPTAAAALSRALTGGALMGALMKDRQRVALTFEGNGPLRKIWIEADNRGRVRGFVANPEADPPPKNGKFDVAGALGKAGLLTVTKDLGVKEPYRGIVQLYTSEIAEDIAYYFAESEQIPSAVGLGVHIEREAGITAAGGFLIQSLPPSDEVMIDHLMERLRELPPISEQLRTGARPESILSAIFGEIAYDELGAEFLEYTCDCSRERVERALISLGAAEIQRLIDEREETEMTCEFCKSVYRFDRSELTPLLEEIGGSGEA